MKSEVISPEVLILGSRYDLTCDFVVSRLRSLGARYLRINSEDLPEISVSLDPHKPQLRGQFYEMNVCIGNDSLRSILFRRPVYLRDFNRVTTEPDVQLSRHQWAAFIRNLMVFDGCRWMNHPTATYSAEHKALQLKKAGDLGFRVPKSLVTNCHDHVKSAFESHDTLAVKGLDTVLTRSGDSETFGFTSILDRKSISESPIQRAPVVFQESLVQKLDLRVTVVGSSVFCASVKRNGRQIEGDWRRRKDGLSFDEFQLPDLIAERCVELTHVLGLSFGAIDLALSDDDYVFIEINPTGEWAWLVDNGLPIDKAISRWLCDL